MTIIQWIKAVKQALETAAKTAPNAAAAKPFSAASKKLVNVGKLGKLGGAVIAAHEVDRYANEVPVIGEIYKTWANIQGKIQTLFKDDSKINDWFDKVSLNMGKLIAPNAAEAYSKGLEEGKTMNKQPIAKTMTSTIEKTMGGKPGSSVAKAIAKGVARFVNDPKFYVNTDMHMAFAIPFNYPDTMPLVYGNGIRVNSIKLIQLGYNPAPDLLATKSRLTQMLDLLKGIRGLSGNLPYSSGDLFAYQWATDYLINEYCRLKFALKLSRCYTMTKSRMPLNVLKQLGWKADDFIHHRADYVNLLVQFSNFITNSWPVFGVQHKRIMSLWDKFIPDSNDGKVAGLIKCDISITYLDYYKNDATHRRYLPFFVRTGVISTIDTQVDYATTLPNSIDFSTYSVNMTNFLDAILSNPRYNALRGDLVGAFGPKIVFTDPKINEINTATMNDMVHEFDELFLTTLQNATYVALGAARDKSTSFDSNLDRSIAVGITFGSQSGGQLNDPTVTTNLFYSDTNYVPVYSSILGDSKELIVSPVDGFKGMIEDSDTNYISSSYFTEESIVIANKYNMSEGEQIEILQFMAFAVSGNYQADEDNDEGTATLAFITNTLFFRNDIILYYNGTSDAAFSMFPVVDFRSQTDSDQLVEAITAWTQFDYSTKLPYTRVDANVDPDISNSSLMLDINIMGSISKSAFKLAMRYATYSLRYADVSIAKANKVGNIVDVYNIKA